MRIAEKLMLVRADSDDSQVDRVAKLGIFLAPPGKEQKGAEGIFLSTFVPPKRVEQMAACVERLGARPGLMLVFGDRVPIGYADHLASIYGGRMEVVRLYLMAGEERAVIGGNLSCHWVSRLRHQLADRGIISLVCRMIEVDMSVYHLSRYLDWKRRYYLKMGRDCARSGARLEVVGQALGMDKRIGQEWLCRGSGRLGIPLPGKRILQAWLRRHCQRIGEKTKVVRLAYWGKGELLPCITSPFSQLQEIRLYEPFQGTNPNKQAHLLETLNGADLLMITDADDLIREVGLRELSQRMRKKQVLDACGCFPIAEVAAYGLDYYTFGENTNVCEWN